ncbi:MAG: hypothetical protein VB045_07965 [Synergistaceae bacterium]|nr:hypothetical protein [Synergistaceae bacterium]
MVDDLHNNESFGTRLVAGEGGYRLLRFLVVLFLLAGTVWSGYLFKQFLDLSKEDSISIPPLASQAGKDAERLDTLIANFKEAVDTRENSLTLASAVADASRRPFVATMKAAPLEERTPEGAVVVAGDQSIPTFVQEKIPPIMFVRAIMLAGKESMAIMDIEGVGNGIIVRNGYGFNNGEGEVVRIAPEKVTIRWSGKNLDIAPGL